MQLNNGIENRIKSYRSQIKYKHTGPCQNSRKLANSVKNVNFQAGCFGKVSFLVTLATFENERNVELWEVK